MSEWQPIETAPKDKWILVWCSNVKSCFVAMWNGEVEDFVGEAHDLYIDSIDATHWMPLPEPPT